MESPFPLYLFLSSTSSIELSGSRPLFASKKSLVLDLFTPSYVFSMSGLMMFVVSADRM